MVKYCESAYGVAEGVDALVVATGWPEFRTLDFARIRHLVKQPIIIDTKNLLDSLCPALEVNECKRDLRQQSAHFPVSRLAQKQANPSLVLLSTDGMSRRQ